MKMTTSVTRLRQWHARQYKGCWIVCRWRRDGRDEKYEVWGGTNAGKPRMLFASQSEATSEADKINDLENA